MLLKYPLTDSQYARFQHDNNNAQIQALGKKAGVEITDEFVEDGIEKMRFRGRCKGTMALVHVPFRFLPGGDVGWLQEPAHWECWIQVRSKPWWLPWFALDYGFRQALV